MDTAEIFAKSFFSERIGGKAFGQTNKIYKFEKIKRAKRNAIKNYPDRIILDMGVGEPDNMADLATINILFEETKKFNNRGYADNGCDEFKVAVAKYMQKIFNITLDPYTEILHSIGSKSALSILPLCFINPGDTVLTTTPGYNIFATHAKYLGANITSLPLLKENNFLPNLNSLTPSLLQKTKIIILNYPNNPTGATCSYEFFSKIIEIAHKYSILVINDAAYSGLVFSPEDQLSILQIDGAKDVALELHSMSKGFSMTGWRIGWVCGNRHLINAYGTVKDNTDSGQFLPIQKAAAYTLAQTDILKSNALRYSKRMDDIIEIFNTHDFQFIKPKAGFFIYTHIPHSAKLGEKSYSFSCAEDFSEWMIHELGIVTVPWDDVEPAIRLSMTFTSPSMNEQQVVSLLKERLSNIHFSF